MKIPVPSPELIAAATAGDVKAVDRLLRLIQPAVFNLAVRMLGNREDAADAAQEILMKVVTHLAGFRGESSFGTWTFAIARNHLLTASSRSREVPTFSLDALGASLEEGLAFAQRHGLSTEDTMLSPEEKVAARQVAIGCTQQMLMALDRDHRLAYLLDVIFGVSSADGARILGIEPAAYRKRLSRARQRLDVFIEGSCGLVSRTAACRCARQLPAVSARAAATPAEPRIGLKLEHAAEWKSAEATFTWITRLADAASLFRAHPDYQAPERLLEAIRSVIHIDATGTTPPRSGPPEALH